MVQLLRQGQVDGSSAIPFLAFTGCSRLFICGCGAERKMFSHLTMLLISWMARPKLVAWKPVLRRIREHLKLRRAQRNVPLLQMKLWFLLTICNEFPSNPRLDEQGRPALPFPPSAKAGRYMQQAPTLLQSNHINLDISNRPL
ncbi:hypothetical protein EYF80_009095 [Liparis tanakae]|uniref:Uncharacterized protein n=1 Tax=Liparis tanakae TaxID=230148 RepID=A0A4Z2IRH0_9TELE|nr:hypothetical protein EYF80_009095 [Liparis tanakae]